MLYFLIISPPLTQPEPTRTTRVLLTQPYTDSIPGKGRSGQEIPSSQTGLSGTLVWRNPLTILPGETDYEVGISFVTFKLGRRYKPPYLGRSRYWGSTRDICWASPASETVTEVFAGLPRQYPRHFLGRSNYRVQLPSSNFDPLISGELLGVHSWGFIAGAYSMFGMWLDWPGHWFHCGFSWSAGEQGCSKRIGILRW